MREIQAIRGRLTVEARDARTGALVLVRSAPNLVTTEGRRLLARLLTGQASLGPDGVRVALGTGAEPPAEGDTDLRARVETVPAAAGAPAPATGAADAGRVAVPFTARLEPLREGDPPQAICEAGLVFRPSAGAEVLYNRVVFEPLGRTDRLELTLGWEVLF